jgi:uncharacterized protein YqgV (UPF0045/DUF77 family)
MHERIRQLLSQAGVHYEVLPKDTVYEKFAELIVQECVKVIRADYVDYGTTAAVINIEKHFGVEE